MWVERAGMNGCKAEAGKTGRVLDVSHNWWTSTAEPVDS